MAKLIALEYKKATTKGAKTLQSYVAKRAESECEHSTQKMKKNIAAILITFTVGLIFALTMAVSNMRVPHRGFPFLLDLLHFSLPRWARMPAYFAGPTVGIILQITSLVFVIRKRFSGLSRRQRIICCIVWSLLLVIFLLVCGYFTMASVVSWFG